MGELDVPLAGAEFGVEEEAWWRPRLTYSATTQRQIQDAELVHPNIYPVCELLEQ